MNNNFHYRVAILGVGYVGLPLALQSGKKYETIAFDPKEERIDSLNKNIDLNNDFTSLDIESAVSVKKLKFTSEISLLEGSNFFIVTVPTPIDENKIPDMSFLKSACEDISKYLNKGGIVVFESTVYPGAIEEFCVPILERKSGLKFNKDFFCGYSPERINPGDKVNTLTKIKKVTSGSTPKIAKIVDDLYASIITAGTHLASSIKVAEASKAIENAQRDLNISFVNELALIFDKIGIDTEEVIDAAATKWNFLKFKPGLVGGHCISVDPYYLAYKAESLGYYPEVILSGRRVNDNMGKFVASKVVKLMNQKGIPVRNSKALILGLSFKENCPDIRNSKVPDIYQELKSFGVNISIYDPYVSSLEVKNEFNVNLITEFEKYNAIILAVAHDNFKQIDIENLKSDEGSVIYDIKSFLEKKSVDGRL